MFESKPLNATVFLFPLNTVNTHFSFLLALDIPITPDKSLCFCYTHFQKNSHFINLAVAISESYDAVTVRSRFSCTNT